MKLLFTILYIIPIGVLIGIVFSPYIWDRIKARRNEKQSDSSEPKEK